MVVLTAYHTPEILTRACDDDDDDDEDEDNDDDDGKIDVFFGL